VRKFRIRPAIKFAKAIFFVAGSVLWFSFITFVIGFFIVSAFIGTGTKTFLFIVRFSGNIFSRW
jgi:pilus assembly protein TadC